MSESENPEETVHIPQGVEQEPNQTSTEASDSFMKSKLNALQKSGLYVSGLGGIIMALNSDVTGPGLPAVGFGAGLVALGELDKRTGYKAANAVGSFFGRDTVYSDEKPDTSQVVRDTNNEGSAT